MLFEQRPDPPLTGFPEQGLCDYESLNIYDNKSSRIVSQLVRFLASKDDSLCLAAARLLFDLFEVSVCIHVPHSSYNYTTL